MSDSTDSPGLTARLAGLVAAEDRPMSDAWRDLGERAFVDTVAVLLAGRDTPAVAALIGTVPAVASGGPSRCLTIGRPMAARSAALIDGTSAHALDYDDVDDALLAHPSAVLVPAILAEGEACGASGDDLLDSYRRGLETCRAVAAAIGIEGHYHAGWHSTSTIGTIGAAAAVARLLRLPAEAVRHCFGLAATMAAGSRQNFGTMAKPLHAGLAAERGILAAELAARGFTADPDQLEGPMGFLALYGGGTSPRVSEALPIDADPDGLNVKLYPCCYATHAAIDASLELAATRPAGTEIIAVEVVVPPGGLAPLIHHRPTDGLQAKFSLEYAVAAALLDGGVTLASFDDARVRADDVQKLLRDVQLASAATPPSGPPAWSDAFAAVVTVSTSDGASATGRVDRPAGHATRPVTDERLRVKFADCLAGAGIEGSDVRYETLRNLRHQLSAGHVLDVLVGLSGTERGRP